MNTYLIPLDREALPALVTLELANIPETVTLEEARGIAESWKPRREYHNDASHFEAWRLALLAARIRNGTGYGTKTETLKAFAQAFDMPWTALGIYMGAARRLNYNTILFDRFLKGGGYPKFQYHIRALARADEDPEVMGPEGMAELIRRNVHRGIEALDKVTDDEERDSLKVTFRDSADAYRARGEDKLEGAAAAQDAPEEIVDENTGEISTPRQEPPAGQQWANKYDIPDEFYLMVVNSYCLACGTPGPNDPHHVDSGHGTAMKGSDWTIIPLCRKCHTRAEATSIKQFTEEAGVDQWYAVARILHRWVSGEDLSMPS